MRRLVMSVMVIGLMAPVLLGQQKAVLRVGGAVARPYILTAQEIAAMPHQTVTASAHDQVGRYDQIIVPGEKRPARWIRQVLAIDIVDAPKS